MLCSDWLSYHKAICYSLLVAKSFLTSWILLKQSSLMASESIAHPAFHLMGSEAMRAQGIIIVDYCLRISIKFTLLVSCPICRKALGLKAVSFTELSRTL